MKGTDKPEKFVYWKKPWHGWIPLVCGGLYLVCFGLHWQELREYQALYEAGRVFSDEAWAGYAAQEKRLLLLYATAASAFFGEFLVGALARSQTWARRGEGALLLVLAVLWGAGGLALGMDSMGGLKVIWVLLLLLMLGVSAYCFWRSRPRGETAGE